jgi:molybdenum cofactor biosynthesis enzyme MoaA
MEIILNNRKRRSERMSKEEHRAFVKYVGKFPTKFDAAIAFGFSRVTLNSVLSKGSGKSDTIQMIREKLNLAVA